MAVEAAGGQQQPQPVAPPSAGGRHHATRGPDKRHERSWPNPKWLGDRSEIERQLAQHAPLWCAFLGDRPRGKLSRGSRRKSKRPQGLAAAGLLLPAGGKARQKTVVLSCFRSLRPQHREELQVLARAGTYLEAVAYAILNVFLRLCAEAPPGVLGAQYASDAARREGKLVDVSNAQRALSCAEAGGVPLDLRAQKWPPLLQQAAREV